MVETRVSVQVWFSFSDFEAPFWSSVRGVRLQMRHDLIKKKNLCREKDYQKWHEICVPSMILLRLLPCSCPWGFENLDLIFTKKLNGLNHRQESMNFPNAWARSPVSVVTVTKAGNTESGMGVLSWKASCSQSLTDKWCYHFQMLSLSIWSSFGHLPSQRSHAQVFLLIHYYC